MDYTRLAEQLLSHMRVFHQNGIHKHIDGTIRGEGFVLQYIAFVGDGVLPGAIGQEMGVSSARIAATLNSLEKKGLITRAIDPMDRRRILVRLTDLGREASESQKRFILGDMARMLSMLGEEDATAYVRIQGRLASFPKDLCPPCPGFGEE